MTVRRMFWSSRHLPLHLNPTGLCSQVLTRGVGVDMGDEVGHAVHVCARVSARAYMWKRVWVQAGGYEGSPASPRLGPPGAADDTVAEVLGVGETSVRLALEQSLARSGGCLVIAEVTETMGSPRPCSAAQGPLAASGTPGDGPDGNPLGQDHLWGSGREHSLKLRPSSLSPDGTSSPTAGWEVAGLPVPLPGLPGNGAGQAATGAQGSRSTPGELVPFGSLQAPTELSGAGLGHGSELLGSLSEFPARLPEVPRLSGILPAPKLTWEARTTPAQALPPTVAVCWVQSRCSVRPAALEQAPEFPG